MSNDRVVQAVERFGMIPQAKVDRGILRVSDEAFRAKLEADWTELHALIVPYQLPADYQFFLEYYGGLSLSHPQYLFQVRGMGFMRNGWYFHLVGTPGDFDEGMYSHGLLEISILTVKGAGRMLFFLDLGGTIARESIVCTPDADSLEVMLQTPHAYPDQWTKIADTFSEWLERAVETQGTFGYIPPHPLDPSKP